MARPWQEKNLRIIGFVAWLDGLGHRGRLPKLMGEWRAGGSIVGGEFHLRATHDLHAIQANSADSYLWARVLVGRLLRKKALGTFARKSWLPG
jgi:hypothetical protein